MAAAADRGLGGLAGLVFDGWDTRFVLFTGKGGVGKTTIAAASALGLARRGRKVLVVSTDPASNLSDVFAQSVGARPTPVEGAGELWVADLDPLAAAAVYRESVVGPYRGVLPASALSAIEEQLSGACTMEVAAFGEFTRLLGKDGPGVPGGVDHVIFDTAPTGHTLRMLELPRAWEEFLSTNDAGVSCLGPLSALEVQRAQYAAALAALRDPVATTVVLVTRPEDGALGEAARAGTKLAGSGLDRQVLVINGVLAEPAPGDSLTGAFAGRQERAWAACASLEGLPSERFGVGLMCSELTGLDDLVTLAGGETSRPQRSAVRTPRPGAAGGTTEEPRAGIEDLVDALVRSGPSLVLVMGKGGVGKTTLASALGVAIAARGEAVTLSTTDPAAHLAATVGTGLPETLERSRGSTPKSRWPATPPRSSLAPRALTATPGRCSKRTCARRAPRRSLCSGPSPRPPRTRKTGTSSWTPPPPDTPCCSSTPPRATTKSWPARPGSSPRRSRACCPRFETPNAPRSWW
jgi:arsenite-transporting ATPase